MNIKREEIEAVASLPPAQRKMTMDMLGFLQGKEKERRKLEREAEQEHKKKAE